MAKNKMVQVRFSKKSIEKMDKIIEDEKCSESNRSEVVRKSTMNYVDKILKNTSGNGKWCLIECKDFIKKFISRAYADKNYNVLKEEK